MRSLPPRVSAAICLIALCLGVAVGSPSRNSGSTDSNAARFATASSAAKASDADDAKYRLPDGFLFGAGTSAYQTEGAWDTDGKGVNVFDYTYHSTNVSTDRTGDVAADSYNRYKEDISIASELGLNVLRISIAWTRIFPTGRNDNINKKGVQHYHDVIDEMRRKNIEPLVTIYHFDHPQTLQDEFDGWLGNKMPDVFAEFADYLFSQFGSKVRYWLTINEAAMYCNLAGGMGMVPPHNINTTEKNHLCLHHLILGHAKAHKIYHDNYSYNGSVGFGVGPSFSRPATETDEDVAAADKANLSNGIGLSIDPLIYGDYPEVARASRPAFTDEEKELLKGRIDFVGVNIYSGDNATASGSGDDGGGGGPPGGGGDDGGGGGGGGGPPDGGGGGGSGGGPPDGGGGSGGGPPDGGGGGGGHGLSSAWTLRELPKWVKKMYGDKLPVFFTESGTGSGTSLDDWESRAVYCSAYLRQLALGLNEDKTNVFGYTMWSFVDTFEFGTYSMGWGMVHVDYEGRSLNRTLKKSSTFFKRLTKTRVVPLVESGSEPFPDDSGSASIKSSFGLALIAVFAAKRFL